MKLVTIAYTINRERITYQRFLDEEAIEELIQEADRLNNESLDRMD